ncbi:MAG: type 4a pilus biogenesis protein PilO [Lacunisphaera sp.]
MTSAELTALLKKHPVGVAGALVAIACGVMLYLKWGDLAASQAENEARSAEAAKVLANVRNSANLPEQVAEIQALRKELDGRLMKASQIAVNLQYFYKLETENEVKLVDVRQGNTVRLGKSSYVAVPFAVTVEGTYAQVVNFLGHVQNGRHFCRVITTTFTKAGGSNMPGASDMTLTMNLELLGQP